MKYLVKKDYLAKAQTLPESEQERLLSRLSGKLPQRLDKEKLTREEAMAIQMEIEDEQLNEWRQRMHELQAKAAAKAEKEANKEAKKETKPKKADGKAKTKGARKKDAGKAQAATIPEIVVEEPAVKKTPTTQPLSSTASKANGRDAAPAPAKAIAKRLQAKIPKTAS